MRKIQLIVLSISLFVIACNEMGRNNKSGKIIQEPDLRENCVQCDSIYSFFPENAEDFEFLFGYPNGELYDGAIEIQQYFKCFETCFRDTELQKVIRLGSEIKYDADAPTYLKYGMTDFLMKNELEAKAVYKKLSCNDFSKHANFLFESIHVHDSFHSKICSFLEDMEFTESCKKEIILKHCQ